MSERRCYGCEEWIEWATKKCPHCGAEYDLQGITAPKESFAPPAKKDEPPSGKKTTASKGGKATGKKPASKKRGKNPASADSKASKSKKGARPSKPHDEKPPEAAPVATPPAVAEDAPPQNGNGNGVPEKHDKVFCEGTRGGLRTQWTEDEPDNERMKSIDYLGLKRLIKVEGKRNGGGVITCTVTDKGKEWIEARNWSPWEGEVDRQTA